jgi:hypothetical protein
MASGAKAPACTNARRDSPPQLPVACRPICSIDASGAAGEGKCVLGSKNHRVRFYRFSPGGAIRERIWTPVEVNSSQDAAATTNSGWSRSVLRFRNSQGCFCSSWAVPSVRGRGSDSSGDPDRSAVIIERRAQHVVGRWQQPPEIAETYRALSAMALRLWRGCPRIVDRGNRGHPGRSGHFSLPGPLRFTP